MKRREEEILNSLLFLSEKTKGFIDLEPIMMEATLLEPSFLSQGLQEIVTSR
jgi:hypothetical protein